MPLFTTPDGGERYVEPTPRRPNLGLHSPAKANKLRMYRVWWDYKRVGLSYRDIAQVVDKPLTTVTRGIALFATHLAQLRISTSVDVDQLVPAFGAGSYVPARERTSGADCSDCGNVVRFDTIVCPYCFRVTDENQLKLDVQLERTRQDEAKATDNRRRVGEPSAELTAKWAAQEKVEKRERAAQSRRERADQRDYAREPNLPNTRRVILLTAVS